MRPVGVAALFGVALSLLSGSTFCHAAETAIVSTMGLEYGSPEIEGCFIVPATDVPNPFYSEDKSPSQVFEVIRPDMEAFRIGRLMTSCGCLSLGAEKQSFRRGERALLVLRNVKPTPAGGAKYAFFVQIADPPRGVLQYDVFVKSTGNPGPPPVKQPSRPEVEYERIAPYAPQPLERAESPSRSGLEPEAMAEPVDGKGEEPAGTPP